VVNENKIPPIRARKLSTKAFLLTQLRSEPGKSLSGALLAQRALLSRVAIWKAAEGLQSLGYPLRVDERGYCLDETEDDFLYPWEFGEREKCFYHYVQTDSTMNRARELAQRGINGGSVVVAESQSAGRGRAGRPWESQRGGLFCTFIERPLLSILDYPSVSMAMQIAVAEALEVLLSREVHVRWPNDVYVGDRKIAGILTELYGEGDHIGWILLGVGINVQNEVEDPRGVSCRDLGGNGLSRRIVLNGVLGEWEKIQKAKVTAREIAALWNQKSDLRGKRVVAVPADHGRYGDQDRAPPINEGVFLGVDSRGRAVLRLKKKVERYAPGSLSLQRQQHKGTSKNFSF